MLLARLGFSATIRTVAGGAMAAGQQRWRRRRRRRQEADAKRMGCLMRLSSRWVVLEY